jgi:hypothetical protein
MDNTLYQKRDAALKGSGEKGAKRHMIKVK